MNTALTIMNALRLSLPLVCVLNILTTEYAAGCDDGLLEVNGRCCNQCPPGEYLKEICTEHGPTVCSPCPEGYFSDHYGMFDRCEECKSCQQEYAEKCTPTTNANCSCRHGFLCSNNICSSCVENKCVTGDRLKRIETLRNNGLIEFSYHCEPLCPSWEYFDLKENVCKPRARCNLFGFKELFPGNKTHDSVCDRGERSGSHVLGWIGIILILLVFLLFTCFKKIMVPNLCGIPPPPVFTKANDFHLSQEERGLSLIVQDRVKTSNNLLQPDPEKLSTLCICDDTAAAQPQELSLC